MDGGQYSTKRVHKKYVNKDVVRSLYVVFQIVILRNIEKLTMKFVVVQSSGSGSFSKIYSFTEGTWGY